MIERETKREIPDRPHYYGIEVEALGRSYFRIPNPVRQLQLLEMLAEHGTVTKDPIQGVMLNVPPTMAIVGECWFHEELDLETPLDLHDPIRYGMAILDELHEHGTPLAECARMGHALADRFADLLVPDEIVDRALDFSERAAGTRSTNGA